MFDEIVQALKDAGMDPHVENKGQRVIIRDEEHDEVWIVSARKYPVRKIE